MKAPFNLASNDKLLNYCISLNATRKIILITTCTFTYLGLQEIILKDCKCKLHFIHPKNPTKECFLFNEKLDLMIIEAESYSDSLFKNFVKQRTLPDKIIFLTENNKRNIEQYRTMRGITFIADKSIRINTLKLLIKNALSYYTLDGDLTPGKHQYARMAEFEVLTSLLNGEKPDLIAKKMGITYNSVSRYKVLALKRLGAKNLNELITGSKVSFVKMLYESLSL